jgi:hypothetical protein
MVGAVMDGQSSHTPAASKPIAAIVIFVFTDRLLGVVFQRAMWGRDCRITSS